ncbi:MAG: cupin domain-containing protein [Ignavibacteriales bacterium]|nr:cupin domain-containing protein [Ignavibacteriales bacterium]
MQHHRVIIRVIALMLTSASILTAQHQQAASHQPDHIMVMPGNIVWSNGPASLPAGAKIAIIEGDLTKPGLFTARLKLPANYAIRPHWHPADEHITVIAGTFYMGLGETFNAEQAKEIPVGGFAVMATGTRHFALTKNETIIQLHGMGPWAINYINPADDPRKKAQQ